MYENDVIAVSNSQLKLISELAERQLSCEAAVLAAEEILKERQETLRKIVEKDLPEAMAEAGCKSYTLMNGRVVSIKDGLSASIPAARKQEVCGWLREHGFGDIVSEDVELSFGRGEENKAHELAVRLQEEGLFPVCRTDVNTARLKALISEQLELGKDMPLELLGAYVWKKSVVK